METIKQLKLRFNKEKYNWITGILVWAICFLAIELMMTVFPWLRYAGLIIIVLIIWLASKGLMDLGKTIKRLEANLKDGKE